MNDKEIFQLTDITSRKCIEKISFDFQDMYCDVCTCTIERNPRGTLPVQSHANNSDDALKSTLKLLEEVKQWDKRIPTPSKDDQPYENGYHREMIDEEHEVEYKRRGKGFVITGIHRKDQNGFYYTKNPYPVDKKHKFVQDLPDGTQLWTWDDIGFLSGTAGAMIVKDGLIIKTKMTAIA